MNKLFFKFTIIFCYTFYACQPKFEIYNPYENVDWTNDIQYKANLHTHTTRSDGSLSPQAMVDLYYENDYKILSITDHNIVTYPWEKFTEMRPSELCSIRNEYAVSGIEPEESRYNPRGITPEALIYEDRYPSEMGMVAIQGNEITLNREHRSLGVHDMGSYFSDHSDISLNSEETLLAITKKNGLAFFMHPGEYNFPTEWYMEYYKNFNSLVGIELYNRGETRCIQIWDSLLVNFMPERPIWGFSNDDTHTLHHFGGNYNIFILPELNESSVRHAMEEGNLFYVFLSQGKKTEKTKIPFIESIDVDSRKGIITINSSGNDSISWMSGGRTIHAGNHINLNNFSDVNNYIRAVLFADKGNIILGTQPFGIKRKK